MSIINSALSKTFINVLTFFSLTFVSHKTCETLCMLQSEVRMQGQRKDGFNECSCTLRFWKLVWFIQRRNFENQARFDWVRDKCSRSSIVILEWDISSRKSAPIAKYALVMNRPVVFEPVNLKALRHPWDGCKILEKCQQRAECEIRQSIFTTFLLQLQIHIFNTATLKI